MELDHTDDVAMQSQKIVSCANEVSRLTELLKDAGKVLNDAEIMVNEAISKEDKRKAKSIMLKAKGVFKSIQADIK